MEELDSRLNSNNPIVISQIFSKIVQNIKDSSVSEESGGKDSAEIKFLKERCTNSNSNVSVQASEAILHLVKTNNLKMKSVLNDFLTTITTTKCPTNIAFLVNNLLVLEMKQILAEKGNSYKCPYNLKLPQHPFIIMFNENALSWSAIFKEISITLRNTELDLILFLYELYRPFFLFIMCNPLSSTIICKEKLWSVLIDYVNETHLNTFFSWMQFESMDMIEVNTDLLIELSHLNNSINVYQPELLLLWQTASVCQLLENNFNPLSVIYCIEDQLDIYSDLNIVNPMILILVKSLTVSPAVYLFDLLQLIRKILNKYENINYIVLQIIKASLLQWIANPSLLAEHSTELCKEILAFLEKFPRKAICERKHREFYVKNSQIINTNTNVYFSVQFCVILEQFESKTDIKQWLKAIEHSPNFFLAKFSHLFFGLFLTHFNDAEIDLKVFELIVKCCEYNRQTSSTVLTLILYKLANTNEAQLHLQLLKSLPKMAVIKENLFKVASTIQALHKGPNTLKTLSTSLMFDLWKVENKCYPFLEKFLVAPIDSHHNQREFYITRAFVLKELCALKPELYGKEIVAHLSRILNECNHPNGDISSALAIEGITFLCKSEIIDAVTTWATLAPMFQNENRTVVMKSICGLISEIPSLSYSEAYPQLLEEVVKKLWEYVLLHDKALEAALTALSCFSLDLIVSQMPESFLEAETAALRASGQAISGKLWVNFLRQFSGSHLTLAGDFLVKMVSAEVSGYLKFVYQVKSAGEPIDYSVLPQNSVVRGLTSHVKSKLLSWKGSIYEKVYLECLRVLSVEYSKPLPPLDWCFLQELSHEAGAKEFCINIAAHQVMLSGTARRFIVNFVEAVALNASEARNVCSVYRNLRFLANSVQPFTLKPFLEVTILNGIEEFTRSNNKKTLCFIIEQLKVTLSDATVQEANKIVIAEIVAATVTHLDNDSELFKLLLECIVLFPQKCINSLTSSKSVKEITVDWFRRAILIRTSLAMQAENSPLNWLNDIIEAASSCLKLTSYIFDQFARVFNKHKDKQESALWLYELLGHIQAGMVDKTECKQITFLCDVFILASVVFSGHFSLVEDIHNGDEMKRVFPRAIATLLDVNHWSICTTQALEWFYHMIVNKILTKEYETVFKESLQCLKHDNEFRKNMKWIKYLNVEYAE